LDYQARPRVLPVSKLAVAALVVSLLGCPCLRFVVMTRPFWTGHRLSALRGPLEAVPVLAMPIGGIVLGVLVWARLRGADQQLRGRSLAVVAICISALWVLLCFLLTAIAERTISMPRMD
jgi:hypothetical protein